MSDGAVRLLGVLVVLVAVWLLVVSAVSDCSGVRELDRKIPQQYVAPNYPPTQTWRQWRESELERIRKERENGSNR